MSGTVVIVPFEDRHAADFDRLNRAWLEAYGLLEKDDEPHLRDPRASIVDGGGALFIATLHGAVVGSCGVHPSGEGAFEIVKLAVDESARGHGLGRRLTERAVGFARDAGARKVTLLSSHRLESALRLYESLGFRRLPMPAAVGYETADVYMELDLGSSSPPIPPAPLPPPG